MSTVEQSKRSSLPCLIDGERLDRATFHERYEAMPPDTRAELIGGIVYMASPASYRHGSRHIRIAYWVEHYNSCTPGLLAANDATIMFDDYGEHQPDCLLLIPEALGGRTRYVDNYIEGPPELVVEVSLSTRRLDLGARKLDYEAPACWNIFSSASIPTKCAGLFDATIVSRNSRRWRTDSFVRRRFPVYGLIRSPCSPETDED